MKICTMYFSPAGTTEKIVKSIAYSIKNEFKNYDVINIDFTNINNRQAEQSFSRDDLVIIGVPVIAGRVPNVLLKYLKTVRGNGASAVAIVSYGNRNYDDALIELSDILEDNGFRVIAGGAFIGEHSFSKILAKDRPDERDMEVSRDFAVKICNKLLEENFSTVNVPGIRPYRDYYKPKDTNGNPVDIRKVVPKTSKDCTDCKICAEVCPVGSIDYEDVTKITGICIKCCACIKKCPVEAKYFDDKNYLRHKHELEVEFYTRRDPEIFI